MHAIKSQARRHAWANSDGQKNYNPFGRLRSEPATLGDEEKDLNLRPYASVDNLPIVDHGHYVPRRHHNTAPAVLAVAEEQPPALAVAEEQPPALAAVEEQPPCYRTVKRRNWRRFWRKEEVEEPIEPIEDDDESVEKKTFWERFTHRHRTISVVSQLRAIFFGTWLNLLLAFVPAGFAVNYTHQSPATIFSVNFVAIVPVTAMLAWTTEQLMLYVGDKVGALISITFSNASQLITSALLLRTHQIEVLQASLLGSILTNLLLMTGFGFLMGGYNRICQYFNVTVAQNVAMFLLLAVLSLLLPTAAHLLTTTSARGITIQSRGTSVIIMVSYGLYLYFQLHTHSEEFKAPSQKSEKRKGNQRAKGEMLRGIAQMGAGSAASAGGQVNQSKLVREDDDEETPKLTALVALVTTLACTILLTFNAMFATDSIQGLLQEAGLSTIFLGVAILPLLSCDPTSVVVAMQDKMDMSIALTLERCMQTALMVVPLIVTVSWGMGVDDMTLQFEPFLVAASFAAVIIVTYVIQEDKSNWLTGALLIKVHIIICLAAYFVE